ncbi:hypothetical protein BO71DRAFT_402955 [Aspergillus ellipticus CBS 707.79]|uniref:Uncharacterized protein n=1 Tax=Aspergillus ellipticus CBS 707.79 TaxID=1448320 RepID=A0A319DEQ9_9EURO|nr:hypothetical protein BO71DRAFT_402955 [Aspergillus ellipticus CBS 707.79]
MERWRESPPEDEPASISAILDALQNIPYDPPQRLPPPPSHPLRNKRRIQRLLPGLRAILSLPNVLPVRNQP